MKVFILLRVVECCHEFEEVVGVSDTLENAIRMAGEQQDKDVSVTQYNIERWEVGGVEAEAYWEDVLREV